MRYSAAEEYGLDQVARDGGAAALATRLGMLLIVLTGAFIVTLMLVGVREVMVRTTNSFPPMQVEASVTGG